MKVEPQEPRSFEAQKQQILELLRTSRSQAERLDLASQLEQLNQLQHGFPTPATA